MIIDVLQQVKEPAGSSRHYSITGGSDSPTYGEVDLVRTDRGIFVSGVLNVILKTSCSRCLSSVQQPLTLRIKEEYLVKAEEGVFAISEGQEIDLNEAVRQYSLLEQPMKPLCREDCPGLCPGCGYNLNLGTCNCSPSDVDSRLVPLLKWEK